MLDISIIFNPIFWILVCILIPVMAYIEDAI